MPNTTIGDLMAIMAPSVEAYGTSEGVKKEWDTRGRTGQKNRFVFQKGPKVAQHIGKQFTDSAGNKFQLVGHNDLNVPYFSKVKNGKVGAKQYTHPEGEDAIKKWNGGSKFGEGGKSEPPSGYGQDESSPTPATKGQQALNKENADRKFGEGAKSQPPSGYGQEESATAPPKKKQKFGEGAKSQPSWGY